MLRIVLLLSRMDYGTMLNIFLFISFASGTLLGRLPEPLATALYYRITDLLGVSSNVLPYLAQGDETPNKSVIQIWIDDHIIVLVAVAVAAVLLILGTCWCCCREARPPTRIAEDSNPGLWVTYPVRDLIVPTKNFSDSNLVGEGGFGRVYRRKARPSTRIDEESNPGSWVTYRVRDLIGATKNFSDSNLLGEGRFARVYRADLGGNRIGAVKRLRNVDRTLFGAELSILLRLPPHPNLVNLLGICSDRDDQMIVFEYVANGTLFSRLHENQGGASPLSRAARKEIARQVAEALRHLHEQPNPPIIHRDVKSKNVLLENDSSAKLADFGRAKLGPRNNRSTGTTPRGTFGYMDPQCVSEHRCSSESDVYSFGVVLLELITGSKALIGTEALVNRTRTDRLSRDTNNIMRIVDQSLPDRNNRNELLQMIRIANRCLLGTRDNRLTMTEVVNMMDIIRNA